MSTKLKILFNTEASFLNSGFANYTRELISRLHATNKYEIAELASYGYVNDPRDIIIKWKYYANAVKKEDPRYATYNANGENQFGKWRFDKVILDFQPHAVIDVRDYWMSSYPKYSPLRHRFHWILMPTIDSAPQQEPWLDTFISADAIFTYSDWGAETLIKQTNNKVKYISTTSPGINLETFKPLDRNKVRQFLQIPKDAIIIGSVMRNQKRKLIPELMSSFRKVLDSITDTNTKSKLFLYLHTSYPDMGWDIPELLKTHGLSNKVLFTYKCSACNSLSCRMFAGPSVVCPNCYTRNMGLSSVTNGVTEDQLCTIYNLFDLYVQYAICEGFGMPQIEAASCGVPLCTVKYSAMEDVIKKLQAYPINPIVHFKEMETKAIRVYPNNQELIDYILRFIATPQDMKEKKRKKARSLTQQHYDWNIISATWQKYLDQLDINHLQSIQQKKLQYQDKITDYNKNMASISSIINAVKNHEYLSSSIDMGYVFDILKNVDYGFEQIGTKITPFSIGNAINIMNDLIEYNNAIKNLEDTKAYKTEDFIQYANLKASL